MPPGSAPGSGTKGLEAAPGDEDRGGERLVTEEKEILFVH